uniref:Serrate RNA effector molecule homolog n=1 Tax=Cacopsylla melanoneura TaxID=428564 RepID=A0A8D8Y5M6_9HEMI
MKLSTKIIQNLDSRLDLWNEGKPESSETMRFTLSSKNPVLQNIKDFLIEEASTEEEELLGKTEDNSEENEQVAPEVLKVLDRLILYLRIVHSVDYYNHCEYPNEDEMPNRCGIIHTRGTGPTTKVTPQEINNYCTTFQNKMSSLVSSPQEPNVEELAQLGAKTTDAEVEKFVAANTQEISADKWLCPLSGKKFKGPDFIRKHIFNKHAEKVDEVKKEVDYFNNYLKDPKRPQLPEHPGNKVAKKEPVVAEGLPPPAFVPPHFQYGAYPAYQPYPRGAFGGFTRSGRGYGRGGRGGAAEYRPVIHYRDLDAPREPEEFI